MSKGKAGATSDDSSCRPNSDCAELIWENGQITMLGESSKSRMNPNCNIFPTTHIPKTQDSSRFGSALKMTNKLTTMESMLGDFSLPGPYEDGGLGQDVEIAPWLSYPIDDSLHNEYTSDFLRELSGVTISDLPTEKKSVFFNSSVEKYPSNFSRSSVSGVTTNNTTKIDVGQPSTSSGITNFPYFSRSGFINKANNPNVGDLKRPESDGQSPLAPVNQNSESFPPMPKEQLPSICQEDVTVNNNDNNNAITKPIMAEETNKEAVVVATSSVCSGNSVERASNESAPDLKRKSRETTESDGPSDEAEEESIGAKKGGQRRTGSKRGRAAEVHNQSERRRRDRINEKMRALQELIPNCNKVDKASMLDEAIEYLKTLQLQVQMLSVGGRMYMQPMMVPPGMQQIHGTQIPHFSPMGMGMGFGMNMVDVNSGMKLMPFQGPQYPVPEPGPAFHVVGGSNLHSFGHSGQGYPIPVQRAPVVPPVSGSPPLKVNMVANLSGLGPSSNPKDVALQTVASNNAKSAVNPASKQV